jgi:tetratricopeptide (TPR) repeat protein
MASNSVFISYRRDVSAFMARAVFQDLRAHDYDVFMDVENIDSGKFDTVILNQIAARPYFLLILTPGTLDRVNEPEDWVRREIEYAIQHERMIIPLTTPNFSYEAVKPLMTGTLADLPRFNGVEVPHSYFDEAMARLRSRFLKPVETPVEPTPAVEVATVMQKVRKAIAELPVTDNQLNAQAYLERALSRPYEDLTGKIADIGFALELNPKFIDALHLRATWYGKARDYENAIADLNRILLIEPDNAKAYYERGILQESLDNAIADFTEAIRINPNHAFAYVRRGFAYKGKDEIEAAVADLKQGLSLDPNHPLAPVIQNYIARYEDQV